MTQFATAAHLASWIGVCPGINESAGINKSAQTRRGNAHLKKVLGTAALSAIRGNDTAYSVYYRRVYYRRVAARRGGKRALVALMLKITIAVWHILKHKVPFNDLSPTICPNATTNGL